MALTKIKVNEIDEKSAPVAGDYALASDSENNGKLALIPFSGIPLPSNAMTTNTAQNVDAVKTFRSPFITSPNTTSNYSAFSIGSSPGGLYWYLQYQPSTKKLSWFTIKGGLYPAPLEFEYDPDPRAVFPISPTVPTPTAGDNSTLAANTAFVQGATANAIYDLPVMRSGLVASGTDVIIFETSDAINPAWYDTTHVLNVSFFARNNSGVSGNTTFKMQLYDADTSTAHTIASITADTLYLNLLQASIYRSSSASVNCNIQYGISSSAGYVSLASGSYKLRAICTSDFATVFSAAQVRFTK